jgi:hypothetical protein
LRYSYGVGGSRDIKAVSGDPRNPWWELRVIWLLAQQQADEDRPARPLDQAA